MKRVIGVILALSLATVFIGCKSTAEAVVEATEDFLAGLPDVIANAYKNAPEDVLIATGSAKMVSAVMAKDTAEARARAKLTTTLSTMVSHMADDYAAEHKIDASAASSFKDSVTNSLSRSHYEGADLAEEIIDEAGECWVAFYLDFDNASEEINKAVTTAKLAVSAMEDFDPQPQMAEMFKRAQKENW